MSRLAFLQFAGPGVIFAGVSAADYAAYALSRAPSSPTLWYINLELLGIFQASHEQLGSLAGVAHSELLFIAVPLFLTAVIGGLFRISLLVALASNLSCLYASFLVYVWYANEHLPREASLAAPISITNLSVGPSSIVCGLMLGATLLSLCVSHIIYIRRLRRSAAS